MPTTIARRSAARQPHSARPTRAAGNGSARETRAEAASAVLMQFRLVIRAIKQHYRGVEKRCGISGAQLWALAAIDIEPGLSVNDLGRELAIHQSTASNLVDKLEDAGLVERRRLATDRRVVRLFATIAGRRLLRRAPKPLRGVLQETLRGLPLVRLQALHEHLDALTRAMGVRARGDAAEPLGETLARESSAPRRASAAGRRQGVTAAPRRRWSRSIDSNRA